MDLDAAQIGRNYPVDLGLVGDARQVLAQILSLARGHDRSSPPQWAAQARAAQQTQLATWDEQTKRELAIVASLQAALPENTIIANDMTVFCYWMLRHFAVHDPRSFLFPQHFGALGFALPAAIGARIGHPERPVLAICGDGGFMFSVQELATAVKYGLKLAVLLCNDNCYSSVRLNQQRRFPHPPFEVDVVNPDFMLLAKAYGANGIRLGSLDEVGNVAGRALEMPGLTIVEAPIDLKLPS